MALGYIQFPEKAVVCEEAEMWGSQALAGEYFSPSFLTPAPAPALTIGVGEPRPRGHLLSGLRLHQCGSWALELRFQSLAHESHPAF